MLRPGDHLSHASTFRISIFFDPNNALDLLDPNHIFEFQRCCKHDVRERSTRPCFKVILAYSAMFLGTSFFFWARRIWKIGGVTGDGVELLVIFLIADQEIALFTWSQNWAVPVRSECLTVQLWPSISCNYL